MHCPEEHAHSEEGKMESDPCLARFRSGHENRRYDRRPGSPKWTLRARLSFKPGPLGSSETPKLDAAYIRGLGRCAGKDLIIGGHAAFGLLAKRYGSEPSHSPV